MSRLDDHIRSFGMSGYQITDDLEKVETKFTLELGHLDLVGSTRPTEFYPQFEQETRSEAAKMSRHYELFFCLENAIRKLICETLEESEGANWWDSGRVPPKIASDVKDRLQKEIDSGVTRRSDNLIDYTNFGELSVIINSNWDLFGAIFNSRRAVEKVMNNLNVLRGPIAHCCPISEDETGRLMLTVKDWFRMIG